jgi:hypothetical protein
MFQHGSLKTEARTNGNDVWVFRWREPGPNGTRIRRKVIVGTKRDLPTKAKAEKAVAALRMEISKEQPERVKASVTVTELAAHYCKTELGEAFPRKAYSPRKNYQAMIDLYILPRWGDYRLGDVRTVAVEEWLHGLDLADASKAKVRNVYHAFILTQNGMSGTTGIQSPRCARAPSARRTPTFWTLGNSPDS